MNAESAPSMTTMTPATVQTAPTQPVRMEASPARRQWLGVRLDALVEIAVVLAVLVAADMVWGSGSRFAQVWPHPFGIIVLLAASYYGTREGLAAVLLCSAVMLLGRSPQDGADLGLQSLPLQVTMQPLAWGFAALVFGEIRDTWRRRTETLREELEELRERSRVITLAYDRLQGEKEHLESRVAGQVRTVKSMYDAARAIQRQGVGDVLIGVGELVRSVLAPQKFSLYLLNGSRLEATISEGWTSEDSFGREFDESSPLYHAVVFDRRCLVISQSGDEPVLRGEGLMAGPVADSETGRVVGMLKIEGMRFLDLHSSGVQNFRILCEWIGSALAQAQRVEDMNPAHPRGSAEALGSAEDFTSDRERFRALAARSWLSGQVLYLGIGEHGADSTARSLQNSRTVGRVARQVLELPDRCYQTSDPEWPYAAVLPGLTILEAKAVAERFAQSLAAAPGEDGPQAMVRRRLEPLRESAS